MRRRFFFSIIRFLHGVFWDFIAALSEVARFPNPTNHFFHLHVLRYFLVTLFSRAAVFRGQEVFLSALRNWV